MVAIDEGESRFRSTATVTITIIDTNDNSPKFPKDTYKLSVPEHASNGTVIANFKVSLVPTPLLEKVCGTNFYSVCFSFPRRRTLTQWIKATSTIDCFQTACGSPELKWFLICLVVCQPQALAVFQIAVL